jgi:hypothetical protein
MSDSALYQGPATTVIWQSQTATLLYQISLHQTIWLWEFQCIKTTCYRLSWLGLETLRLIEPAQSCTLNICTYFLFWRGSEAYQLHVRPKATLVRHHDCSGARAASGRGIYRPAAVVVLIHNGERCNRLDLRRTLHVRWPERA